MSGKIPRRLSAASQDCVVHYSRPIVEPTFSFILEFEGQLDEDRVERAVRLAMDAEPVLGCRFVEARRPYWERRDDLDLLRHCEVISSSEPRSDLAPFIARPCDASKDPLLQARILRGRNDALCLKISHVAADGAGGCHLLYLLARIYRGLADRDFRVTPNLGSRSRMQWFRHEGFSNCAGAFFSKRQMPPRVHWVFPTANRDEPGPTECVSRQLGPDQFDRLRRYAKQFGATLNDVCLASYFRCLFRLLEPGDESAQFVTVPVDLRRYLPSGQTEAICNFSTPFFPALAPIPNEPFENTLRRVTAVTRDAEGRKQEALRRALVFAIGCRLAGRQMKKIYQGMHSSFVRDGRSGTALSNIGAIDAAQLDFGLPLTNATLVPPMAPGLFCVVYSFRKELRFTLSYNTRIMRREDVDELWMDSFMRELPLADAQLCCAGGAQAAEGSVA
jgi:NRPS condensation-like uncharacterized protein